MKVNCSHIIVLIQPTVWNRLGWALNSWGWQSESWLLSEEFQKCQIIKLEGGKGDRKGYGDSGSCRCFLPLWKFHWFVDLAKHSLIELRNCCHCCSLHCPGAVLVFYCAFGGTEHTISWMLCCENLGLSKCNPLKVCITSRRVMICMLYVTLTM